MYLTEQEAVQKWCPMVRDANIGALHAAVNRNTCKDPPDIIAPATCIGSACMFWRWDQQWESATEEGQGGDLVLRLKRLQGEPKRGYCGLAGEPK